MREAVAKAAELVVVPEPFSVGYCYDCRIRDSAEIRNQLASQMLLLSRQHGVCVAGTLPERSGAEIYNTCVLAEPLDRMRFYRKRQVPFPERLYFRSGTHVLEFSTHLWEELVSS